MTSIVDLSLREVSSSIRRGQMSSLEVTQACLHVIERLQPTLNCFINVEQERALAAARRADAEIRAGIGKGPLHGVPLAHKDIFLRAGEEPTAGSRILRHRVATETALPLQRLDASGAVYLGSLNMSEFAGNPTGHNAHFGDCRNPWDVSRVSGGSSSGSAVAVAARTCYASLGSDTGGSVRTPAAMCGVYGFKPTYGRISRQGLIPRSWSLDTVGIVARTSEDCATVAQAVFGHKASDSTTADVPVADYAGALSRSVCGLRIGVPPDSFIAQAAPLVQEAWKRNLRELESLGAIVVELPLFELRDFGVVADAITKCEAAAVHDRWLRSKPDEYSLFVRSRIEAGFHIASSRYLQAVASRTPVLQAFVKRVFGVVDLVHTPVVPIEIPRIAEIDLNIPSEVPDVVGRITAFVRPFSYLGLPALSVPSGFLSDGMPTAFQLVGRPFAEALILNVAHQYEQAFAWHRRLPTIVEDGKVVSP